MGNEFHDHIMQEAMKSVGARKSVDGAALVSALSNFFDFGGSFGDRRLGDLVTEMVKLSTDVQNLRHSLDTDPLALLHGKALRDVAAFFSNVGFYCETAQSIIIHNHMLTPDLVNKIITERLNALPPEYQGKSDEYSILQSLVKGVPHAMLRHKHTVSANPRARHTHSGAHKHTVTKVDVGGA